MVLTGTHEADAWARQLRKGVLDLAILCHLRRGDVHGYALIAALKDDAVMAADGGEATVYQALQRLAKTGLAASAWSSPADGERPRKIYQITPAGREALDGMNLAWTSLADTVGKLLETE